MNRLDSSRPIALLACCTSATLVALAGALIAYLQLGIHTSLPYEYFKINLSQPVPTIDQVVALPRSTWSLLESGGILKGETQADHYWIRIKIPHSASPVGAKMTTVVGIPLMYVEDVDFFLKDEAQEAPRLVLSGRTPSTWASTSAPTYKITSSPTNDKFLYAHLETTRLLKVPLFILSENDYLTKMNERRLFISIVNGGLLFMIVLTLVLYLCLRQPLYLYICAFQAFLAVVLNSINGETLKYLQWLTPTPQLHRLLIAKATVFVILSFGLAVLELFPKLPETAAIMRRWRIENIVIFVIMITMPVIPESLHSLVVAMVIITVVIELTAFAKSSSFGSLNMRPVIVLCSSFWTTLLITLLAIFGLVPNSIYLENAYVLGQFLAALILAGELVRRTQTLSSELSEVGEKLKSGDKQRQESSVPSFSEESYVSIMFVDIVSFSLISEQRSPESIFPELSERLRSLTQIIEKHGGSIDRSLGDGLLCFFAHGQEHHAVRAFRAAIAIQQSVMGEAKVALALEDEHIIMPVRIGIHSDKVAIGNIAGAMQIDFTMVGQGVNFASNLEKACGPFQIMISCDTHSQLIAANFPLSMFSAINIAVKHKNSLQPAFEHNPFRNDLGDVNRVMNLHYGQLGTSGREVRYQVPLGAGIILQGEHGEHQILDFSLYGIRTRSNTFLGQNAVFEATINSTQTNVDLALSEKLLRSLTLEVCWSRSLNNYFEHGLKIVGSSQEQAHFRVALMLAAIAPSHQVRRLA